MARNGNGFDMGARGVDASRVGKVAIVGAGPGDPDLLTIKAARLIGQADAVVFDHLVGAGIVGMAKPGAQLIYVGKEASRHTLPQAAINALLVRLAAAGLSVVRLKGGDPFIFGRGGEELEALVEAGIPFEVVPGITAASGCAAYAGIPLTHRDHAQAVTFVTGHLKDDTLDLDWVALARPRQTIVFYMGVGAAGQICRQLMAHGMPAHTPAAVIRNGTQTTQATLVASLDTLPRRMAELGIAPPALIVVGGVVSLQEKLAWFSEVGSEQIACEAELCLG